MENILSKIQEETLQVLHATTDDINAGECLCKKTVFTGHFMKRNKVIKECFDLKFLVDALKRKTVSFIFAL